MPLLPFHFLFKPSRGLGAEGHASAAPPKEMNTANPLSAQHMFGQGWRDVDVFNVLQSIYERWNYEGSEGQRGTMDASPVDVCAEELSTAELTTRVWYTLQQHTSSARLSGACVQLLFVKQLQGLVAAHRMLLTFLRSGGGDGVLQRSPLDVALSASTTETSAGAPTTAFTAHAARTLALVLSANLYTISVFLDATSSSPSQPSEPVEDGDALAEAVLPLFFFLITLTLDVAAAAAQRESRFLSADISPVSALWCAQQREGSNVLCSLLNLCLKGRESGPLSELRWVTFQHVLRRLQPILFVALPLPRHHSKNGNGAPQRVGGVCDGTDAGLVLWMAERLGSYPIQDTSPHREPPPSETRKTAKAASSEPEQAFLQAATAAAATTPEQWQTWCLVALMRTLTMQLTAPLSFASHCTVPHAFHGEKDCSGQRSDVDEDDTADCVRGCLSGTGNGEATRFAGHWGVSPSSRIVEYASILGPAIARLQSGNVWPGVPQLLRGAVEELRAALQHLDVVV